MVISVMFIIRRLPVRGVKEIDDDEIGVYMDQTCDFYVIN